MERVCGCNSTGGWTRVAYLNMTDPSQQCPWTLQTRSSEPRRLCGRGSSGASCDSVTYSTFGMNYRHVCGRVIAYQHRTTDAFHFFGQVPQTIEGYYVDGVSLTHGSPGSRQHIWTFAAGYQWRTIHPAIQPHLVHVLTMLQHYLLSPPLWEMTTFVRVGIPTHHLQEYFTQMIHSGMVRVVELPPAVS